MDSDNNHQTANFTLYPALLKQAGYATHALGKWDVGFMVKNATATARGFDTFFGYYLACNADYWYHTVANGGGECLGGKFNSSIQDWADNVGNNIQPGDRKALNGTYNRNLLSARASSLIAAHDSATPLYMYLAFQNVHEGCARPDKLGMQAPLDTVNLYNTTVLDTYKIMGAMLTELDLGVGEVVQALKAAGMYDDTLIWMVSDNGGPLERASHCKFYAPAISSAYSLTHLTPLAPLSLTTPRQNTTGAKFFNHRLHKRSPSGWKAYVL